ALPSVRGTVRAAGLVWLIGAQEGVDPKSRLTVELFRIRVTDHPPDAPPLNAGDRQVLELGGGHVRIGLAQAADGHQGGELGAEPADDDFRSGGVEERPKPRESS